MTNSGEVSIRHNLPQPVLAAAPDNHGVGGAAGGGGTAGSALAAETGLSPAARSPLREPAIEEEDAQRVAEVGGGGEFGLRVRFHIIRNARI